MTTTLSPRSSLRNATRPVRVVIHRCPEADYQAIYRLVERVDDDLTAGRVHYRNRAGMLLTTLDEIVRAVLADDLQVQNAN